MTIKKFIAKADLINKTEIDKAKLLIFYYSAVLGMKELSPNTIAKTLEDEGFAKMNTSRLLNKMKKSKDFAKGSEKGTFKLSVKITNQLISEFPQINKVDESIDADETILPNSVFENTRGYIEKICQQINGSYEHNYFDGCAVLMRRLLEMLLILTYQKNGKEFEIQDAPNEYKNLNYIINFTKSNNQFHLSKGTLDTMDEFRKVGNFSAHRIQYNCKRRDIDAVKKEFRVGIEELIYKAGIK